jgi:hypothetical protein
MTVPYLYRVVRWRRKAVGTKFLAAGINRTFEGMDPLASLFRSSCRGCHVLLQPLAVVTMACFENQPFWFFHRITK